MSIQQYVEFDKMTESAIFRVNLFAEITEAEEGGYVAYCPTLGVCSQGETRTESKNNIKEAIQLFIESSYKLGMLSNTLKKCGFRPAIAGKKTHGKVAAKAVPFRARQKSGSSAPAANFVCIPAEISLHTC